MGEFNVVPTMWKRGKLFRAHHYWTEFNWSVRSEEETPMYWTEWGDRADGKHRTKSNKGQGEVTAHPQISPDCMRKGENYFLRFWHSS